MAELEYPTKKLLLATERLVDEDAAFAIYKKRLEDNLNYSGKIANHRYNRWNSRRGGIRLSEILDLLALGYRCNYCWDGEQEDYRKNHVCDHEGLVLTVERIEGYCDQINSEAYSKTLEEIERLKEAYKTKRGEMVDKIQKIFGEHIDENPPSTSEEAYKLEGKIMASFDAINHLEHEPPLFGVRGICSKLNSGYRSLKDLKMVPERKARAEIKIKQNTKRLLECMGIEDKATFERYDSYKSENQEDHTSLNNLITEATWLLLKYPERQNELYWLIGKAIRLPERLVHEWNLESEFRNIKEARISWKALDYPDYPC